MTHDRAASREPSEIAGRYQVVQKLGAGAFGTVYKAKDKILGRMVAIKTIRLDGLAASAASLDELLARFKREAQVSAQLKHPNIVTIYDIGEAEGLSYLAMEFIDGVGLDKVIAAGRLPLERAAAIAAQIAEALDYAHKNNVVHRDIKPANVMIESSDRVKVTDFGIAKAIDSGDHLTVSGSLLGTPSYMSPEQARGAAIDGRSDLFSVGCILYEMLVGRKAFRGDSITALIFKIITEEPQPIREIDPSVSDSVTKIIARALSKAPETRYQNGRELAADLLALTSPGSVPTIRQVETPTVKAPTADADATRVGRGPAVPPPTQVSARTAVAPPPLPHPVRAAAPQPAPAKRSTLPLLAVLAVLGLGFLAVAGVATWFLFLRTPAPTPTATEGGTAAASGGVEVASSSPVKPLGSESGASQTSEQPTPEAAPVSSSGQSSSTAEVNPSPTTAPPRVASAAANTGRAASQPPAANAGGQSEGGGGPDFAFLDQEAEQAPDGREAGQRVAEQFGASSRGGSFGTQSRFRPRARSPQPRNRGEGAAIATMRFLMNAQERFNQRTGRYGTLSEIGAGLSRFLDVPFQARGFERRGYRFNLVTGGDSFSLTASPQVGGMRSFVGDDSGFIRPAEE